MTKQELESWLCGAGAPIPTPAEVADVLGVALEAVADTALLRVASRLERLHFTLAVLRDVFAADDDVRGWLARPRAELQGRSGLDLLLAGRTQQVEDLAVREWHRPSASVAGACARVLALARTG